MKKIKLSFEGCKYFDEVHERMKKVFGFPEYYGENLSALWDLLQYWFDEKEKVEIEVYGLASLPEEWKEEMELIFGVFDRVHKKYPNVSFVRC